MPYRLDFVDLSRVSCPGPLPRHVCDILKCSALRRASHACCGRVQCLVGEVAGRLVPLVERRPRVFVEGLLVLLRKLV